MYHRFIPGFLGLLIWSVSLSCSYTREKQPEIPISMVLDIPTGFPKPEIPVDNPITAGKVALGKRLFNDPILSRNKNVSCAGCHIAEVAFSDTTALSLGTNGTPGQRNSTSLVNVAYGKHFFKDGGIGTLELQVLAPFDNKEEFDLPIGDAVGRLLQDKTYIDQFDEVFDTLPDVYGLTRAIASYERTLIFGNSPYDRYLNGNKEALSESAVRGMALFNSSRLNCTACHSGFLFTNQSFENIGLYEQYPDSGRARITLKHEDAGKFVVPTLRNASRTAPYMHDGSMNSLDEVIDFYATGGKQNPNKSVLIKPFSLTSTEKADLILFIKSLSDNSF